MKLNLPHAFSLIEGHDDPTPADLDFSFDEDGLDPPVDVDGAGSSFKDPNPPAAEGKADQNAQCHDATPAEVPIDAGKGSAPPFDLVDDDQCGDDTDCGTALGDADQSPTDDAAAPLNAGDVKPMPNGNDPADSSLDDCSASSLGVAESESVSNEKPAASQTDDLAPSPDVGDPDPGSNATGLDTCLQHFEMLHCLAADHDGGGYLELKGRDVCPESGKQTALMLDDAYLKSYLWAGIGNFDPHSAESPKQMVDAVMELTAESKVCHLYAPMAIMRCKKRPGARREHDIAAVLGLVAHLKGIAAYGDLLPLDPDYVLACGDQVQAFYLLEKPAKVDQVKPVAEELRWRAKCDPATTDLAHDRWVPGTFRWSAKGPEPVQVLKPWDGKSRSSLADLCVALGLPKPKLPSVTVGIAPKTQPDADTDEADFEIDPWPKPLGAAAFHGLAGELVKTISPHSEADEPALMLQFLTAAGNAIGRDPHARVEGDRHSANLFVLIAGASSTARKGVSLGRVLGPLKRADSGWAGECIKSGLSTGEGLIHHVRDPIEKCELVKEKGQEPRYETVIMDHGIEDKRLLVVEPEFARTLRAMKRDANTLSAVLRQAWDALPLETMTKASSERATGHHISLIGHITVDELRHCMSNIDIANGLANRLLFVCTKRARYLPDGGALSDEELEKLVEKLRHALEAARKIGKVERDDEARALWAEMYRELSQGRPGLLGAATNRAPAQVLRLSLIYALLDGSKIVRSEHLEAAREVWRYCKDSAAYIFGDTLGNPTAERLLPALRNAGPDGMSTTQIRRDVLKGHGDTKEIQQALYHLRDIGAITSFEVKTGGRTATRWKALL